MVIKILFTVFYLGIALLYICLLKEVKNKNKLLKINNVFLVGNSFMYKYLHHISLGDDLHRR